MKIKIKCILGSAFFYPLTAGYISAIVTIMLIASNTVGVNQGIAGLGLVTLMILVITMKREVSEVHCLVNSRTDKLEAKNDNLEDRIDQLILLLQHSEIDIPPSPSPSPHRRKDDN